MNVTRSIASLLLLALTFVSPLNAREGRLLNSGISGIWAFTTKERKNGVPLGFLSLRLNVINLKVTGTYCYVWNFGKKIDCPDDGEENIQGVLADDLGSASIRVHSLYADQDFKASLRLLGNTLEFNTTSTPNDDRFFSAGDALLIRRIAP